MINKFEISTLVLRVVLGVIFFAHGLNKFQGGIENTAGWFESIGLPGFLAYAVALTELVGGVALILGLFSRVVSVLLALIMVGAIITVQLAVGFFGGYVLDLALLTMAVVIAITGSKAFALDSVIFIKKDINKTATLN